VTPARTNNVLALIELEAKNSGQGTKEVVTPAELPPVASINELDLQTPPKVQPAVKGLFAALTNLELSNLAFVGEAGMTLLNPNQGEGRATER
jgi:hypothetical protein